MTANPLRFSAPLLVRCFLVVGASWSSFLLGGGVTDVDALLLEIAFALALALGKGTATAVAEALSSVGFVGS